MNTKVLLAISLLLNVGLGFYALRKPSSAPPEASSTAAAAPAATGERTKTEAAPAPGTNTVVKQFNWESVESPDYKQYLANLRSIGCPEDTIRDIIQADVGKLYDQKKKLARGQPKKFEYWKGGNVYSAALGNADTMQKMRALDDEKNDVLRALGIEPDFKSQAAQMVNPIEAMFDFLPETKRVSLLKVMTDMQTKVAKAMEDGGRPDSAVMAKAQKEMEQAVKQMLTPAEALDFDLRMSLTANSMRTQIAGFDPSEEEFLKVFQLRKPFDDEFSPLLRANETEPERRRREEAEKQLKEQIKQSLGPQRYAEYERSQDFSYQQIYSSVKSADLGTAAANQVYEMKKVAEEQVRKIRSDRTMAAEQRTATLNAIRQETEKSLQGVLGQKGWENYNRPMNTRWLNSINPAPRPPPAPVNP